VFRGQLGVIQGLGNSFPQITQIGTDLSWLYGEVGSECGQKKEAKQRDQNKAAPEKH
jgi:hypothetical protein